MHTLTAIQTVFPSFEKSLAAEIEQHAMIKNFEEGTVLMRTGQYIKSTMLVVKGKVKIYREDEDGNEFLCITYCRGRHVLFL